MKWQKYYSREYGVQYAEVALWMQFVNDKRIRLKAIENQAFAPEQGNECYYAHASEWAALEMFLAKEYGKNTESIEEFVKNYISLGEKYVSTSKEISRKKYESNEEISKEYEKYWVLWTEYTAALLAAFILNDYYSKIASEKLQKYFNGLSAEQIKEFEAELLRPSKKAALLQLKELVGKKSFEELFEEFQWLSCLDVHNTPFSEKEFKEFLEHLKAGTNEKYSFTDIVKELKFSEEDLIIIKTAKDLAYLKDVRDDFRRKGVFYAQPFFELIAKKMGLSLKDFSYLLKEEIIEFLKNEKKVGGKLIDERRNGFLLFIENKKTVCVSGKEIAKELEVFGVKETEKEKANEVHGLSASKGIAFGKAKIVLGVNDLEKVERGDVLIAVTTHPDFVVAMSKAVAIVTDEGGVLCHAAIVSREMRKPCIVGTKHATKTFKDGEEIEVDGNKGIVKRKE